MSQCAITNLVHSRSGSVPICYLQPQSVGARAYNSGFFTYPVSQSARAGFFLRVAMAAPIVSPEHCELLDAVQVAVDRMWREQGSQIANPAGFKVCLTVCCVV